MEENQAQGLVYLLIFTIILGNQDYCLHYFIKGNQGLEHLCNLLRVAKIGGAIDSNCCLWVQPALHLFPSPSCFTNGNCWCKGNRYDFGLFDEMGKNLKQGPILPVYSQLLIYFSPDFSYHPPALQLHTFFFLTWAWPQERSMWHLNKMGEKCQKCTSYAAMKCSFVL